MIRTSSITFIIVLVAVGIFILIRSDRTNTDLVSNGYAVFDYNDKNVLKNLSEDDLITIKKIFDNKKLYKDNPSCGFSENIAVVLDNSLIFCIAQDNCPIIYYKNKKLFFRLSNQEKELLYSVLTQYGFYFPCL